MIDQDSEEEKIEIYEEINRFNIMIEDAKQRYINKDVIDGMLEFHDELDLQRYIDSCNYEKTEFIKEYFDNRETNIEKLNDDDKKLIKKIMLFKKFLPEEMHKCIGCPCLEYDYPQCENCSFQDSCLSGNPVYPDECDESQCFRTFEYMDSNPFLSSLES